jgi:SAM-dependent methyltransferase
LWDKIYKDGVWSLEKNSGPGSDPNTSSTWLSFLQNFIEENNIRSILDLGSGDGRLTSRLNLKNISYVGIEASSSAIALFYKNNRDREYKIINSSILEEEYPQSDLIIIKDVLQHNTNSDVNKILNKIKESCSHALICEDFSEVTNLDINPGEYRPISLALIELSLNANLLFKYNSGPFTKAVYYYKRKA